MFKRKNELSQLRKEDVERELEKGGEEQNVGGQRRATSAVLQRRRIVQVKRPNNTGNTGNTGNNRQPPNNQALFGVLNSSTITTATVDGTTKTAEAGTGENTITLNQTPTGQMQIPERQVTMPVLAARVGVMEEKTKEAEEMKETSSKPTTIEDSTQSNCTNKKDQEWEAVKTKLMNNNSNMSRKEKIQFLIEGFYRHVKWLEKYCISRIWVNDINEFKEIQREIEKQEYGDQIQEEEDEENEMVDTQINNHVGTSNGVMSNETPTAKNTTLKPFTFEVNENNKSTNAQSVDSSSNDKTNVVSFTPDESAKPKVFTFGLQQTSHPVASSPSSKSFRASATIEQQNSDRSKPIFGSLKSMTTVASTACDKPATIFASSSKPFSFGVAASTNSSSTKNQPQRFAVQPPVNTSNTLFTFGVGMNKNEQTTKKDVAKPVVVFDSKSSETSNASFLPTIPPSSFTNTSSNASIKDAPSTLFMPTGSKNDDTQSSRVLASPSTASTCPGKAQGGISSTTVPFGLDKNKTTSSFGSSEVNKHFPTFQSTISREAPVKQTALGDVKSNAFDGNVPSQHLLFTKPSVSSFTGALISGVSNNAEASKKSLFASSDALANKAFSSANVQPSTNLFSSTFPTSTSTTAPFAHGSSGSVAPSFLFGGFSSSSSKAASSDTSKSMPFTFGQSAIGQTSSFSSSATSTSAFLPTSVAGSNTTNDASQISKDEGSVDDEAMPNEEATVVQKAEESPDEDVILELEKVKMYRWKDQQWHDCGIHPLRILQNKKSNKKRVIVRNSTTGKVEMNSYLVKERQVKEIDDPKPNLCRFTGTFMVGEQLTNCMFRLNTEYKNDFANGFQM